MSPRSPSSRASGGHVAKASAATRTFPSSRPHSVFSTTWRRGRRPGAGRPAGCRPPHTRRLFRFKPSRRPTAGSSSPVPRRRSGAAFARRSVGEWIERLTAHGVPCAPVNNIALALGDAQAIAREAVVGYEHPVLGEVRTVATPLRLSASPRPIERAPFLGEHTAEILADVCGYSAERIAELAGVGVFGDPGAKAGG